MLCGFVLSPPCVFLSLSLSSLAGTWVKFPISTRPMRLCMSMLHTKIHFVCVCFHFVRLHSCVLSLYIPWELRFTGSLIKGHNFSFTIFLIYPTFFRVINEIEHNETDPEFAISKSERNALNRIIFVLKVSNQHIVMISFTQIYESTTSKWYRNDNIIQSIVPYT